MHAAAPVARRPGRPPKVGPSRFESREALVRCGAEILTGKGFDRTGIDEAPKRVGSALPPEVFGEGSFAGLPR